MKRAGTLGSTEMYEPAKRQFTKVQKALQELHFTDPHDIVHLLAACIIAGMFDSRSYSTSSVEGESSGNPRYHGYLRSIEATLATPAGKGIQAGIQADISSAILLSNRPEVSDLFATAPECSSFITHMITKFCAEQNKPQSVVPSLFADVGKARILIPECAWITQRQADMIVKLAEGTISTAQAACQAWHEQEIEEVIIFPSSDKLLERVASTKALLKKAGSGEVTVHYAAPYKYFTQSDSKVVAYIIAWWYERTGITDKLALEEIKTIVAGIVAEEGCPGRSEYAQLPEKIHEAVNAFLEAEGLPMPAQWPGIECAELIRVCNCISVPGIVAMPTQFDYISYAFNFAAARPTNLKFRSSHASQLCRIYREAVLERKALFIIGNEDKDVRLLEPYFSSCEGIFKTFMSSFLAKAFPMLQLESEAAQTPTQSTEISTDSDEEPVELDTQFMPGEGAVAPAFKRAASFVEEYIAEFGNEEPSNKRARNTDASEVGFSR